ncbi:MAG: c-type cytochrome [Verrucomicrobia bacterium]|nr:c-type cytochrome [Verrucomicrobiota bacterium]
MLPSLSLGAPIKTPTVNDSRLEISLFASEPNIMTPVGLAIDQRGRIFVLESHTHFPPADYPGPKFDRVKLFQPATATSNAPSIFAGGFHHAMNLAFSPDGQLYLTHRNGVIALHEKDGDGVSESRTTILEMKTPGDYPHNGLGGIAFSSDGWLYVGMGENLGVEYTLKGSDGNSHTGGGEGGNVFRCRPDGSKLQHVATGFWNPFALAFYKNDFLLAVDNDPDSRPPCRLLDVVIHGDYGFKFRYGRSGLHPFTAWNGELPGTLPMIAGTGEAPSGILDCAHARLPADYHDALLVTSWGDHRLELFRTTPFGASLRADREALVEGDEWFRPVAIAAAPDGSIYFTDWVDRNYSVHQKGRIWRLTTKADIKTKPSEKSKDVHNADRERMNRLLRADAKFSELIRALADRDPFIRSAAISTLAQPVHREMLLRELDSRNPQTRLGALLALRQAKYRDAILLLDKYLADPDQQIRLMALIWAGEDNLSPLTNRLNPALSAGPVSPSLLRAYTAASQILTGAKPAVGGSNSFALPATGSRTDGSQSIQIIELETKPDEGQFIDLLTNPAHKGETQLRIEAVRSLAGTTNTNVAAVLNAVARDNKNPPELRAEAIVAMASQSPQDVASLTPLLDDPSSAVRVETARALRLAASESRVRTALEKKLDSIRNDQRETDSTQQLQFALHGLQGMDRPRSDDEWRRALAQPGDVEAGRRVFFSPVVGCAKCHRIEDHGGAVGPDLSVITRGADRERLMQSILHPSQEIAPQFVSHTVETKDNQTFNGISPGQGPDGSLTLIMADGKGVWIPAAQVVSDTPSNVSLMPEGLEKGMTLQDFRDLMAFVQSRK